MTTPDQKSKRATYMRSYRKRWMANASPEKKARWYEMRKANQALHPQTGLAKSKRFRDKIRELTLAAYGGVCVCCGEDELVFLTVDHIIPVHNRARPSSYQLCLQLRKQGFPSGYQILCFNCNHAKGTSEACPHQRIVKRKLHGITA
jgi:5-methylcytosine-specific restriction endonuclease McrA